MRHSKKKADAALPEQDAMGSEDDFAPGGADAEASGDTSVDPADTSAQVTEGDSGSRTQGDVSAAATPGDSDLAAERDRYLRLAAEYDNYRKRSAKERHDAGARAQADLVRKLID